MKDFIKSVLATMVGIFGFFIVMGVLTMMSIIGMVASSSAAQNVEENSVFVLNLSGTISYAELLMQQIDEIFHVWSLARTAYCDISHRYYGYVETTTLLQSDIEHPIA